MLDKLQDAVLEGEQKSQDHSADPKYRFDKLRMFFGEDYEINGVTISQPKIGDILRVGEREFYSAISPFVFNSTSIRLFLWEKMQRDWNKVKDIEVFALLIRMSNKEPLNLLFKDIDFSDFQLASVADKDNPDQKHFFVFSESQNIIWNEEMYDVIAEYIREMLNSHPKVEKAKGKTAKSWIIQEDKMKYAQKSSEEENRSNLLSLISTCTNHPGFKYKLQELKDVGICQFMDSVQRIQKYESSTAALKGIYSGFVDVKSINKELFNFMGDL